MTQPLLLEQLRERGIAMSAGQLNALLSNGHDVFQQEKAAALHAGMAVSDYLQTGDTGARHGGKTGYCTDIGNELFAWFASTESTSRINFLSLLQAERSDYVVNAGAIEYMAQPRHWSPEQVIAVYEFLQQLSEQLRHPYHADFIALLGEQTTELIEPTNPEADFDQLQLGLPFDGFDDPDDGYEFPF